MSAQHRKLRDRLRKLPGWITAACALIVGGGLGSLMWWTTGLGAVPAALGAPGLWSTAARMVVSCLVATGGIVATALLFRPYQTLRRSLQQLRRGNRTWPLFVATVVAVLVGGVLLTAGFVIFGTALHARTDASSAPTQIDVLKTALTLVAGVGGAVALVVAYRRQKDLEQGRFVERFSAAASQLGHPDPAVRIAGVYAMAGVADESTTFGRRQQCIDVLCGYLRLPYDPDLGSSHHTQLITTTTYTGLPPVDTTQKAVYQSLRQNDREVRQTIVRVLTAHLQTNADTGWGRHDFDFTGVSFENASFDKVTFGGKRTSFDRAVFTGERTSFDEAAFTGERTSFDRAAFTSEYTLFDRAAFYGERTFFNGAVFSGANTTFNEATFSAEYATFDKATFSGEYTVFNDAAFSAAYTSFDDAAFSAAYTSFDKATFSGGNTSFHRAVFSGGNTSFIGSAFSAWCTSFDKAVFSAACTSFHQAAFDSELTLFLEAAFNGGYTDFIKVAFNSKHTVFREAAFDGQVDFSQPLHWNNVRFDWDHDINLLPTSMRPRQWPPRVADSQLPAGASPTC